MKAVVLGALGQLGEELVRQLPDAVAFDRRTLDVTDAAKVRAALVGVEAEVVFNATSNNRVDAAQGDPAPAFAVNALAVRELAVVCRERGCRLVHFSTNYVFGRDPSRRRPYREDEAVGPINVYGASKAAGEELAVVELPGALIVRTAALIGPATTSRNGFLRNMMAKAEAGEIVRIVNDQTIAPTRTADLATAAIRLAEAGASGVYHVNGPEATTWYELARCYFELAGLGDRVKPVRTAEIGAAARRPEYSVLGIDKYLSHGFAAPLDWRAAVAEYHRIHSK